MARTTKERENEREITRHITFAADKHRRQLQPPSFFLFHSPIPSFISIPIPFHFPLPYLIWFRFRNLMTQSGDPIRQCSSVAALVAVVCCCCCIIRCESTRKNKANKGKRQRKDRRQQQRAMRKVQRKFDRWQEEEEATQHKSQKSRESIPVSTSFDSFYFVFMFLFMRHT